MNRNKIKNEQKERLIRTSMRDVEDSKVRINKIIR